MNALKKHHFWSIEVPTDCSWIWRRILNLRGLAVQLIKYHIGNGLNTSLWFDPWWQWHCLAKNHSDLIIIQAGLPPISCVADIIVDGSWALPRPNSRHHHVDPGLQNWLDNFDFPTIANCSDSITWDNRDIRKIKTWCIWNSIRFRSLTVPWHNLVWHKLKVTRYAHHEWQVCLDRFPTIRWLVNFGMEMDLSCYLCINREENCDHLFLTSSYSHYILEKLTRMLHTSVCGGS